MINNPFIYNSYSNFSVINLKDTNMLHSVKIRGKQNLPFFFLLVNILLLLYFSYIHLSIFLINTVEDEDSHILKLVIVYIILYPQCFIIICVNRIYISLQKAVHLLSIFEIIVLCLLFNHIK